MAQHNTDALKGANGEKKVIPEVQVEPLPRRRSFTAEYKLRILRETEDAKEDGKVGAILRREGLYSSYLTAWRAERDQGALAALKKKRGRKPTSNPLAVENDKLRRQNAALLKKLEQAEVIIDIQKKVASLLGIPLNAPNLDEND